MASAARSRRHLEFLRFETAASATLGLAIALGLFTVVFAAAMQMTKTTAEGAASTAPVRLEPALESLVLRLVDPMRPGEISAERLRSFASTPSGTTSWLPSLGLDGAVTPMVRARIQPAPVAYEGAPIGALDGYRVAYLRGSDGAAAEDEIKTIVDLGASIFPMDAVAQSKASDLAIRLGGFEKKSGSWSIQDARKVSDFTYSGNSNPACVGAVDPRAGLLTTEPARATLPELFVTPNGVTKFHSDGAPCWTPYWQGSTGNHDLYLEAVERPTAHAKFVVYLRSFLTVHVGGDDHGEIHVCAKPMRGDTCTDADYDAIPGGTVRASDWTSPGARCAHAVGNFCTIAVEIPASYQGMISIRLRWTDSGQAPPLGTSEGWFIENVRIAAEKAGAPAPGEGCTGSALRIYLYCNPLDGTLAKHDLLVVGSYVDDSYWLDTVTPILRARIENGMGLLVLGGNREGGDWEPFGLSWTHHYSSTAETHFSRFWWDRALDEQLLSTPYSLKYWYGLVSEMFTTWTPGGEGFVSFATVEYRYVHHETGGGGGGGGGGGSSVLGCLTGGNQEMYSLAYERHVKDNCPASHAVTTGSFFGVADPDLGERAGCVLATAGRPTNFNFYNDGAREFFANALVHCRFLSVTKTMTTYPVDTIPDGAPLSHAETMLLARTGDGTVGRIRVSLDSW